MTFSVCVAYFLPVFAFCLNIVGAGYQFEFRCFEASRNAWVLKVFTVLQLRTKLRDSALCGNGCGNWRYIGLEVGVNEGIADQLACNDTFNFAFSSRLAKLFRQFVSKMHLQTAHRFPFPEWQFVQWKCRNPCQPVSETCRSCFLSRAGKKSWIMDFTFVCLSRSLRQPMLFACADRC